MHVDPYKRCNSITWNQPALGIVSRLTAGTGYDEESPLRRVELYFDFETPRFDVTWHWSFKLDSSYPWRTTDGYHRNLRNVANSVQLSGDTTLIRSNRMQKEFVGVLLQLPRWCNVPRENRMSISSVREFVLRQRNIYVYFLNTYHKLIYSVSSTIIDNFPSRRLLRIVAQGSL